MLRGGALLKEMLLNFQPVYSPGNIKYFAYSAVCRFALSLALVVSSLVESLVHLQYS